MSTTDAFWAKVNKSGECWEWTARRNKYGYGEFRNGPKIVKAHRFSYEGHNGPIPEGMIVDHICHNPACVKPDHLRAATHKQNQENRIGAQGNNVTSGVRGVYYTRGRWQARLTHHGVIHTAGMYGNVKDAEAAITALRNELFTHNDVDRRQ